MYSLATNNVIHLQWEFLELLLNLQQITVLML